MYAPIVNTEPIPRTGLGHNNGGVKNVRLSIVRKVWKCEATVQLGTANGSPKWLSQMGEPFGRAMPITAWVYSIIYV